MTREDKELLLKDLCARLPYGVKVSFHGKVETLSEAHIYPNVQTFVGESGVLYDAEFVKPYLRPMSSMTAEEEKEEYLERWTPWSTDEEGNTDSESLAQFRLDYLLERHFDYRGLIEKGLAIEVTEENNPYK